MFVESAYFATLRIPFVAGRDFAASDRAGAQPVAVVNETAAQLFWFGEDAVGKSLIARFGGPAGENRARPIQLQVVAVVADLRSDGTELPTLYLPLQQHYVSNVTILARAAGSQPLAGQLRAVIGGMDPRLPPAAPQTLESQLVNGPVETQLRVATAVAGSVGLVGLLLAAIGLYGVTAHAVTRRTREIGIRLSLGAARADVVGLILRQGMTLVTIGAAIGSVLSLGAGRILAARFGDPTGSLPVFLTAALLFLLVGLIACYMPVRRATRISAVEALRYE